MSRRMWNVIIAPIKTAKLLEIQGYEVPKQGKKLQFNDEGEVSTSFETLYGLYAVSRRLWNVIIAPIKTAKLLGIQGYEVPKQGEKLQFNDEGEVSTSFETLYGLYAVSRRLWNVIIAPIKTAKLLEIQGYKVSKQGEKLQFNDE